MAVAPAHSTVSFETRRCAICSSPLTERYPRVVDALTRETFQIAACAACGLGYTLPVPADLAEYYGTTYHGGRHGFTARYCAARRVRMLRHVSKNGSGRLLDVGCGDGTFLLAARAAGWRTAGTELNPELARAEGLDVHPALDGVRALAPFDAITLWHVLEHLPNPGDTLDSLRALLAPGGVLIIAVPDARGLQARWTGAQWLHLDVPRHLTHFGSVALGKMLARYGFLRIAEWHGEFEYDVLGWSQSALNRFSGEPNVFFDMLTGRMPRISIWRRRFQFCAGVLLSAVAVPLTVFGMLTRRSGTLIVAAKKSIAPHGIGQDG